MCPFNFFFFKWFCKRKQAIVLEKLNAEIKQFQVKVFKAGPEQEK